MRALTTPISRFALCLGLFGILTTVIACSDSDSRWTPDSGTEAGGTPGASYPDASSLDANTKVDSHALDDSAAESEPANDIERKDVQVQDKADPVDKTPLFVFDLDSERKTPESINVRWQDSTTLDLNASFPSPDDPYHMSEDLLTIRVDSTKLGSSSEAETGVVYWTYCTSPGSYSIAPAECRPAGSCTMVVTRAGQEGLFEGEASGTVGDPQNQFEFSVKWRQPMPLDAPDAQ